MSKKKANAPKSRKLSIFNGQYLRFYLMFLIPCFISAAAMCCSLTLSFFTGRENINHQAHALLKAQAIACEADIKTTITALTLFASQPPLRNILYHEDMAPSASDACESIKKIESTYPAIDSVMIYSQKTDTVLWQDALYPSDTFYTETASYSLYNQAYWKSFRLSNAAMIRTLLPTSITYDHQEKVVLPVVTKKSGKEDFANLLIINFDLNYLIGAPSDQKISQNSRTYIFNRYNNSVINSYQNPNTLHYSEDFIDKLTGSNDNCFTYQFGSQKAIVNSFSNTSSFMGYTYFSVTPYRDVWALIFPSLIVNIIASIIMIAMAFGIAMFNARRTTLPIHELFTVAFKREAQPKKNIIADLKESTISLAKEHSHLMSVLPVAQAKFLMDFLNDRTDYTTGESAKAILKNSLTFQYPYYAVVIVQISFKPAIYDIFSVSDCAGLEQSLQSFIKNLFSESFDTLVLQDEKKSLYIILNSDDAGSGVKITETIHVILSALSTDIANLNVHIGKSKFYSETEGLKKAYQEAVFSLSPISEINGQADGNKNSEISYIFKKSDETELFNALIKLDMDRVLQIINKTLEQNAAANTRSKQQLYYVILNSILKILRTKEIPYRETMLDFEVYNSILNLPPMEIQKQISSILNYMQEYVKENPEQYASANDVQKIIEYIKVNYTDPFLSLDMLAEHFGIETYKISNMIKKELGIGFHDFLTDLRMNEAKRLLTASDLPIKEITTRCGLSSEKTFFRVFKTKMGITPNTYRKNFKASRPTD